MSKIDNIFCNVHINRTKLHHNYNHVLKSNFKFFQNNMKNIDWVSLNLMNKLGSTYCLSQKIFNEAQYINTRLRHIKLPLHHSVVVNNRYLDCSLHYHVLNDLKVLIPNIYLRSLVLSCFQQDLTSRPCLNIFYNTQEIDQFNPEQSSILYTIDTLNSDQMMLTVTYLGHLVKNKNAMTNKNYTEFGARTSIVLSKDTIPIIKYYNFIK